MKIYSKLVYDLKTGKLIEEDSFKYEGIVALCGSGGGGTTTYSSDPEFNARMATISEQQQQMAQEYFEYYKSGTGHFEEGKMEQSSSSIQYEGHNWTQYGADRQYYDENGTPSGAYLSSATGQILDAEGKEIGKFNAKDSYSDKPTKYFGGTGATLEIMGVTASINQKAQSEGKRVWVADPDAMGYQEWEQQQLKANAELLPGQTAATKAETEVARLEAELAKETIPWKRELLMEEMYTQQQRLISERELMGSKTELERKQAELGIGKAELGIESLPWERQLAMDRMYTEHQQHEGKQSLIPEYYKKVAEGVNVQDKMAEAKTDVQQAYSGAEGAMRREAGRMGVDPNSGRYASMRGAQLRDKAKDVAGAGTTARRTAEEQQFTRLKEATQ